MQTFSWFDEIELVKSLSVRKMHMCKLLAGSSKMNQQKVCHFDFCMGKQTRSCRTRYMTFCIGLSDCAMILSIDVDVVMKR